MELVCPAGSLPALKAAVDNGADAVYLGFQDVTNARRFAGLNFSPRKMAAGIDYVRRHNRKVFVAINTYAQAINWQQWQYAIDAAADLAVDALILADLSLLEYAARSHPSLRRHLSVQGSATNSAALAFYHDYFGISRAVLPRVLSLKQVVNVAQTAPVELEVFGFGSLCIMAEGRCHLSSYVTGESPNTAGVCSPAAHVRWDERDGYLTTRLNGVVIDHFEPGETAGYPTLCKGRFEVNGARLHALEEPTSLNTLALLPQLQRAGIKAIKIEGRQRSPAYVADVVRTWRQALDRLRENAADYRVDAQWQQTLRKHAEGKQTTLGAYDRPWQ